jgi:Fe2+ transport system protein FeoA
VKVQVWQKQPCGPLIVFLGNGRLAIGCGVAQKILVEEIT